ncbi:MAG: SDR family NAD(P)-dependent oxidoreductase [Acidimicrobiia bacterium]|nr:SDR family NAD(P)-dependent oxidoreductase [Acidimicrobiia bacterium]
MESIDGRVAVVTGAASGIGLALTEAFVAAGARVVMADVEEEALAAQAGRLEAAGADVVGVLCDVSSADDVDRLADRTIEHFGEVHIVCNNAGVAPAGSMVDASASDWQWVIGVNVMGVAHGVSAFGPQLRASGEGHFVNTASEAGLCTTAHLGIYNASKHAVVGLSEALYRELEGTGVGVSVLCPELVATRIFESERNAPDGTRPESDILPRLREATGAVGMAPADVAQRVLAAITSDTFWIITHPQTYDRAYARCQDLEAGRNPSDPYAGLGPS